MLYIGKMRELFWDNYIIDTDKTTASLKLHSPIRRECVLVHDEPWEGDGSDYHNFFKDKNGIYRMYYLGWQTMNPDKTQHTIDDICICYAESTDGINWVKPRLGLCEFGGSKENNIILDRSTSKFDNFFVMRDSNPACSPDEIYKGIAEYNRGLWCFTSPDGIHFKKGWEITREGAFDSLNVALWDPDREIYIVYFRGYHPAQSPEDTPVRDIRYIVSKDSDTGASRGCSISAMATTFRFTPTASRATTVQTTFLSAFPPGILNARSGMTALKSCAAKKSGSSALNFLRAMDWH